MSAALETFDRELSQHDDAAKDYWYDEGVVSIGRLAVELGDEDLAELVNIWPSRGPSWQRHCAEVLGSARHVQTIPLLLDMVERASPEISLSALETLRDFDPALFTAEQRRRILSALEAAQACPIGTLHHIVIGAFLTRLRASEDGAN